MKFESELSSFLLAGVLLGKTLSFINKIEKAPSIEILDSAACLSVEFKLKEVNAKIYVEGKSIKMGVSEITAKINPKESKPDLKKLTESKLK